MHGALPNAIIAGTNKAGTTSLFRYLADHPQVCASSIKETCFFTAAPDPAAALDRYAAYFSHCGDAAPVRLEASPGYLGGGGAVARAIRASLPEVRLLFLLREPVARLLSFYRRNQGRAGDVVEGLDLGGFVALALAADRRTPAGLDPRVREVWERLRAGCYGALLGEYLELFPAERVLVLFYDDLAADPGAVTARACTFLGIDPDFYLGYPYQVENKTRGYRSRQLHRLVHGLGMGLEPLLNRHPGVRRAVRACYTRLNERPAALPPGDPAAEARLAAYYAPHLAELRTLLRHQFPGLALPAWVAGGGAGSLPR